MENNNNQNSNQDSGKINPITVEQYLKGINFPTKKEGIIDHAKQNQAPDEVMDVIHRLPDQEFHSPVDISKAIGQINENS